MVANAGTCFFKPLVESLSASIASILLRAAMLILSSATVEEWDRLHGINARGAFLCYKYAAVQMIKQGRGGRIIGASSESGTQGTSIPPLASFHNSDIY